MSRDPGLAGPSASTAPVLGDPDVVRVAEVFSESHATPAEEREALRAALAASGTDSTMPWHADADRMLNTWRAAIGAQDHFRFRDYACYRGGCVVEVEADASVYRPTIEAIQISEDTHWIGPTVITAEEEISPDRVVAQWMLLKPDIDPGAAQP